MRRQNPAKTLADLPPGATITLSSDLREAQEEDEHEARIMHVSIEAGAQTLADVFAVGDAGDTSSDYVISWADTQHGWGPLAYDILMERATELGAKLGPGYPNDDARRVWRHYATRGDVEKVPRLIPGLPDEDYDYRKAPKLLLELAKMPNVVYEGDWKRPATPKRRGRRANPLPRLGNPASLKSHATAGYCVKDWRLWQQGSCDTYAHALVRMRPSLRFGMIGDSWSQGAETGWSPTHTFAHDDEYAYDSAGRHRLPYRGIDGSADVIELDLGLGDVEAPDESVIDKAIAHAKRHRILEGAYGAERQRRQRRAANPTEKGAKEHAEALVAAVLAAGGPRLRVWAKEGVGTRVYFPVPSGDFVSISRGGDIQATQRGRATFLESNLHPSWRKAYRAGLEAYRREQQAYFDEELKRIENPARPFDTGKFRLDVGPSYNGLTNHETWNGWEVPYFTRRVAEQIVADNDGKIRFENERLMYVLPDDDAWTAEEPVLIGGKTYYSFAGWTWWPAETRTQRQRQDNPRPRGEPLFDAAEAFAIPRPRRDEDGEDDEKGAGGRYGLQPERGERLYHGTRVSWIGVPGRMLKLGWDQVKPVAGNEFEPEKLAHFLGLIHARSAAGGRARFRAAPAWMFRVDVENVAQSLHDARFRPQDIAYERQTRPYTTGDDELDAYLTDPDEYVKEHYAHVRAGHAEMKKRLAVAVRKKSGDLGTWIAQLRDGNHRAFGAQLAGEPFLWVYVVPGEENGFDQDKLR